MNSLEQKTKSPIHLCCIQLHHTFIVVINLKNVQISRERDTIQSINEKCRQTSRMQNNEKGEKEHKYKTEQKQVKKPCVRKLLIQRFRRIYII